MHLLNCLLIVASLLWSCSSPSEYDEYETEAYAEEIMMEMEEAGEFQAAGRPALATMFHADEISQEQLLVFKQRAIQKLNDLGDYISVVSNTEYDRSLRKHAMNQALELFDDENAHVWLNGYDMDKNKPLTVKQFMKALLNNEFGNVSATFKDISFDGAELSVANEGYKGLIIFKHSGSRLVEEDLGITQSQERTATIVLKKVRKSFGLRSELVWEVLLTGIE